MSVITRIGSILYFCCEIFVFEIRGKNQLDKRIAEKELIFAVIEAEAHFVKIGWEMFRRDFMPRTHNTALGNRGTDETFSDI